MAASLCAASCGHTAPDAVTCVTASEHCIRSACPACAAEGQEEILLGEELGPDGAEVFLPGFESFTQCYGCKNWECWPCFEREIGSSWGCDKCNGYFCSVCSSGPLILLCECGTTLCRECSVGVMVECLSCSDTFCEKHGDHSSCARCARVFCDGCLTAAGCKVKFCDDEDCSEILCKACFAVPDAARKCTHCPYKSVCAAHFGGQSCGGCGQLTCRKCLSKGRGQETCAECCASMCKACRPATYRTCAACRAMLCAACCSAEAEAGGGAGGGGGAGECALCEAFFCAGCCGGSGSGSAGGGAGAGSAARALLEPCAACGAALCSACAPRHRCSATKRARGPEAEGGSRA